VERRAPRRAPRRAALVTVAALAAGAGACSAAGAHRPAAAATPTRPPPSTLAARSRVDRHPEVAVRRAYLQSWDDYARAAWTLDTRGLDRTYAESALSWVEGDIAQRIRDRRRSRVQVTHDITVVMLRSDRAAVTDRVTSSSVAVDADTGADLEGPHADPEYYQMVLERYGADWKVMFVA
jgi:hypothetical protein